MKLVRLMLVPFVIAVLSGGVSAQEQAPGRIPAGSDELFDEGPAGGPLSDQKREEVRRKIETLRVWRMTEALRLDEKTAAKFIPLVTVLDQRRAELYRGNLDTLRELRGLLEPVPPDEKKLRAALEKIEQHHREMMKVRERELEAAKDHLTIEQQARYVLFQHEFQREMRRMIRRAQGEPGMGTPGRGGMGPGTGPRQGRGGE